MNRLRNALTTGLFVLALVAPAGIWVCDASGVELPSWLNIEDAKCLAGGVSRSNLDSHMTFDDFMTQEFQSSLSVELGNHIPCKAMLMLGASSLQRNSIAFAGLPFGWECWPAYYNSDRLYIPEVDAVGYFPSEHSDEILRLLAQLGSRATDFVSEQDDTRICIAAIQGYWDPSVSPASDLMSNRDAAVTRAAAIAEGASVELVDGFGPSLDGAGPEPISGGSLCVVTETYPDTATYYSEFFRTDHHWNWRGITRMYDDIAGCMGLAPSNSTFGVPLEGYIYSGATARVALNPIDEEVSVDSRQFPELLMHLPDGRTIPYDHSLFESIDALERRYGFYDYYYGFVPAGTTVDGPGSGAALIIGDSYAPAILPYIAENYQHTLWLNGLHPSGQDSSMRLARTLAEGGYTDVYFIGNPGDLASFSAACPDYFSLDN